jgi:hypothetical protein
MIRCRGRKWPGSTSLAVLIIFLANCGCGPSGPRVGRMSGTVYCGNDLLPSDDQYTWTVVFVSQDGSQYLGLVGRNGKYAVDVPAGEARIAVAGTPRAGMYFVGGGTKPPLDAAHLDLQRRLERYRDATRSGLTYTVVQGAQSHDVKLDQR